MIVLIDEFLKRDLQKGFVKKLRSLEEEFKKQKIHDVEYYKNKFEIDAFNEIIFTQDRVITNSKDHPEKYIIENTKSMVNYFVVSILEEYRFLITYRKIIKFNFDPEFHKLVLSYLEKNEAEHNVPLISLYLSSILLILERKEEYFKKTKRNLISESGSLSHSDKYSTYAILVNFANDEYQKGNKKFLKESFELYKLILENKLYNGVSGGSFYNPLFRNIVNVALLMKETEWTQNFVKTYINKLMPEALHNTLHLSNARLNFAKGNYERSLEDLSKIVAINHFQVKPLIKSITLMIYIEKG